MLAAYRQLDRVQIIALNVFFGARCIYSASFCVIIFSVVQPFILLVLMDDHNPRQLARLRKYTKLFLIISVIGCLMSALVAVHGHFDPFSQRVYGRLVHVEIGGRHFAIPSEYFRGPIPQGKTNSLYLWMMMPEYAPYKGEVKGERKQMRAAWDQHLIVRVDDTNSASDMASQYNAFRNGPLNIYKPQDVEDAFGLRHTLVWHSNARSPDPWILHDLYYQNDADGQLLGFISCGRDDKATHPGCTYHEFTDGRLLFTLSYRKSNLPRWRQMQDRVRELFQNFSCVPYLPLTSTKNHNGETLCPH